MITPIIAFIFTPLGKIVLIGLALLGAVAFIDRRATYRERARCDAAKIQSKLDASNADLEIARKGEAEAKKALADLAGEKKQVEDNNAELSAAVAKLPAGQRCILPERPGRVR